MKFLLDSGDPEEYREIKDLATRQGSELWGATTNPTLIAKKLTGKKYTLQEAYELQKKIVMEILQIVPGAVSAEVYADEKTKAQEMVEQGREIAAWHERVVVKLPTTLEGLKARTILRKEKIPINNTLVFSLKQIFAICMHEHLVQKNFGPIQNHWPPFISPFVGRLDDIGEDGMSLAEQGVKLKIHFDRQLAVWMLTSSIRNAMHMKRSMIIGSDILTAPVKAYREWFALSKKQQEKLDIVTYAQSLRPIPHWETPEELLTIDNIDTFMQTIESGKLDITHPLTEKGIIRFAQDWKEILT